MPTVTRLRAEHVTDGLVAVAAPRLSWQVVTDHPGLGADRVPGAGARSG